MNKKPGRPSNAEALLKKQLQEKQTLVKSLETLLAGNTLPTNVGLGFAHLTLLALLMIKFNDQVKVSAQELMKTTNLHPTIIDDALRGLAMHGLIDYDKINEIATKKEQDK